MTSSGGCTIGCKMDAGKWDVSGTTGRITHSDSADGWEKVCSQAEHYSGMYQAAHGESPMLIPPGEAGTRSATRLCPTIGYVLKILLANALVR